MTVVQRIDEYGSPAWIGLTVLGFMVWWPIGLATLFYALGSGRMSLGRSGRWDRKLVRLQEKMDVMRSRMGQSGAPWTSYRSSGNRAFDDYRAEMLRRLEEEQREFHTFLDRLRHARDKAEFDQFMAERRNNPEPPAVETRQV